MSHEHESALTFVEAVNRIAKQVSAALGADVLDARLVEVRPTDESWAVRWKQRVGGSYLHQYGTHLAVLRTAELPELGEDLLLWGRYDLSEEESRMDFRERARS